MKDQTLPEVQLYSIGAGEAERAAPLLTAEAVSYLKNGDAFGMALAEENEVRAAACVRFAPEDDTALEIISLYTAPAFRRRGLGGTLLAELLELCMAETDGSLRQVTAVFLPGTEGVEALLAGAGFLIAPDAQTVSWRFPVSTLAESSLLRLPAPLPHGCTLRTVHEVSDYTLRRLVWELRQHGIDDLGAAEMRRSMQDAGYVLLDAEDRPRACALFSASGSGAYLSQFFTADKSPAAALSVLQGAGRALLAQLPPDALVEVPTVTASSARLVRKLLPVGQAVQLLRAVLDLTAP